MPAQYEWLVHIPDHPNALEKRLAVRPLHLKNLTPNVESGKVVMGGATLSEQPKEGESPKFTGSFVLMKAESEEEVRSFLEGDEYTKGGAWDVKNAKIWPFKCAIRTAL